MNATDRRGPLFGSDPDGDRAVPGVVVHRTPPLHPDDLGVVDGIPITSVSRTLIGCAECVSREELSAMVVRARALGLLDPSALRASRRRVERRPSLPVFDEVASEFVDLTC